MHENWRRWAGNAAAATTIGAIALTMFSIAFKKDVAWWAAWGQWAGGVGSIAAAAAAVWVALESWQRSEQQISAQTRRLEAEAERAQASKVAAWIDVTSTEDEHVTPKIRNSSDLPIFNVMLSVRLGDIEISPEGGPAQPEFVNHLIPTLPPSGDTYSLDDFRRNIDLIVESIAARYAKTEPTHGMYAKSTLICDATILITFDDCEGRRWKRDTKGRLTAFPSKAQKAKS